MRLLLLVVVVVAGCAEGRRVRQERPEKSWHPAASEAEFGTSTDLQTGPPAAQCTQVGTSCGTVYSGSDLLRHSVLM